MAGKCAVHRLSAVGRTGIVSTVARGRLPVASSSLSHPLHRLRSALFPLVRVPAWKRCAVNVVVLQGRLSRPAEERVLGSGSRLVALEVTIPRPGERADTVPVSWIDPPPRSEEHTSELQSLAYL